MGVAHARYDRVVNDLKAKSIDLTERTIPFYGGALKVLYIRQLVDQKSLSEFIIKPVIQYGHANKEPLKAQSTMENIIFTGDCHLDMDDARVEYYLLSGMVVILFSNDRHYIVANLRSIETRSIDEPVLTYTLHGPRDCFVENLDANLSLLRYRLKDGSIRIENLEIGERTKTRIAVAYIKDIANPQSVQEIRKRIASVKTEEIVDIGELQSFISNSIYTFFPQMLSVERSDMAVEQLLEGKVVVLVEGSCLAFATPVALNEFMYSGDDRYDNKFFGLFMRIIRYIALFISFTASSYYIAVEAFHNDVMTASYALALAQMRSRVPFSAFVGILVLEFLVEMVREAMIRVPKQIGAAIGIMATIIIGQAAISAGFFTPVALILVAAEFVASFAIPYYTLMNVFRVLKFLMIVLTGTFGFFGFTLGITLILIDLVSINNFGVPYMAPYAPFIRYDYWRTLMFNRTIAPKRQQYMRTQDDTRTDSNVSGQQESRDTYHGSGGQSSGGA